MPPIVPKQTVYPQFNYGVETDPDGTRKLIFSTPFEVHVFPLDAEAAERLGKGLTAPTVVLPPQNGAMN